MTEFNTESGYIAGDLVLCIGQSAIRIGREVKSLNGRLPYFQDRISPIFIYVDDFGISDTLVKKSDYYYRYPKRCSTYFEGYECGHHLVEYILTIMESSDTCQALSLIYSADEGLGSGVTAFMVQYIAKYLPGLVVLTVGILGHMSQGGLASVNTSLVLEQCLEFSQCCMLRRMDETTHILSTKKPNKSSSVGGSAQASVYEDVSRCLAADILLAIREIQWPLSLCSARNKLVDVRSSLWQDALNSFPSSSSSSGMKLGSKSNSSSGSGSGSGGSGENTHHQSLRLMSSNLHSLHVSVPLGKTYATSNANTPPSALPASTAPVNSSTIPITSASVLSISKASSSSTSSSQTFCDIDFESASAQATVLSILHGATQPDVRWTQAFTHFHPRRHDGSDCESSVFSQHRVCAGPLLPLPTARHGSSGSGSGGGGGGGLLSHLSAVCFTSPYAAAILQEAVAKAVATTQAGAYAYWLNNEHFRSGNFSGTGTEGDEATGGGGGEMHMMSSPLAPTEQIKLSLHNLQEQLSLLSNHASIRSQAS